MTQKIIPTNDNRILTEARLVTTSNTFTGNAATTDIIRVGSSN